MKRIALSVLVLCSLASAASYQVVDSNGKVIGPVIAVMQGGHVTEVAISVNGQPLIVDVTRVGFQMTNILLFTTPDCTGQAYWDASSSPFPATVVSGDNKLYAESGADQAILVLSALDPVNGCFQDSLPLADAVPVNQVLDLNVFKTPFKVRPQTGGNTQ